MAIHVVVVGWYRRQLHAPRLAGAVVAFVVTDCTAVGRKHTLERSGLLVQWQNGHGLMRVGVDGGSSPPRSTVPSPAGMPCVAQ